MKVAADSKQNVVTAANGVSAAAVGGVSGTVSVTVSKRQTRAGALDGATLRGARVDVTAADVYDFFGEAATIGASGTAAVGVTAMVNVLKNSVEASLGRNSIVYARSRATPTSRPGPSATWPATPGAFPAPARRRWARP